MPYIIYRQQEYAGSDLSGLQIDTSYDANCIIASGSDANDLDLKPANCQKIDNTNDRYGICQYTECTAMDGKLCIFPFKYILIILLELTFIIFFNYYHFYVRLLNCIILR